MNSYSSFFTWINTDRPGLEHVRAKADARQFEEAAEALLAYYRTRKGVNYYNGWDRRELNSQYDTTQADQICQNHILGQKLPQDIDWQADPHHDPEWKYCLHRHEYLTELGRAYWYTGNEKYTLAFKRLLTDWIKKNPMPDLEWMLNVPSETSRMHFMRMGNWRPLTLGIRMYTSFVPCFYHFLHSPNFTPDFLVQMLTSMVEHARHTRLYYTRHKSYFNVSPNWGLMESNGLAHMGILFPEFKESTDWQVEAMSRFEEQARMQVLPDGMQVERASGYHLVCTFCFLQILDLALRNNIRVSDTYKKVAESMIDWVMSVMKPHGVYPMLKDGDESDVFGVRASYGLWEDINNLNMLEDANDLRWVLKTGARLFDRPDMLSVATHGKSGHKPKIGSVALRESGFYTMRTGWEHDDLYSIFTCGELGVMDQSCVHGNADALSLDLSGFGETLLIDPGRYMYEGPYRIWFKSTKAHNTIVVDGQDSSELADGWMFKTKANSTLNCWAATDQFDYVDGWHDGYQRLKDPVTHRRRIVFIKPCFWLVLDELTAGAPHLYDQYFHFGADAELTQGDNLSFTGRYKNGAGIMISPLISNGLKVETYRGSTDPIQGWVSYDYGVKRPAHALKFSKSDNQTTYFATLLVPFKNRPRAYQAEVLNEKAYRITDDAGSHLILFSDGSETKQGDFEFDGEVLCARFDNRGRLTTCSGAHTSLINYKGKRLLDSVGRMKIDAGNVMS
ncbi:MAG TPA: alginate lyase family protein [Verrucomicrobiae bacterium]|nr:alginate lyase family protein [Verrucomicrobiae bacterium]